MYEMMWKRLQVRFRCWVIRLKFNLPYQKEKLRIEHFGDVIERIEWVDRAK